MEHCAHVVISLYCSYIIIRCNGNGLKRGRPSLKADEKFKCDKCGRNLWSKDQLQLHAEKCDGNHVERRGRKPGDNSCMVSMSVMWFGVVGLGTVRGGVVRLFVILLRSMSTIFSIRRLCTSVICI